MKTDKLKRALEALWDTQEAYKAYKNTSSPEDREQYEDYLEQLAKELEPLAFGIDAAADKLREAVDRSVESKLGIKREKIEVGDEVYYLTDLGICWGKVEKVVSTDTNITFYKLKRDRRLRSRVFSSREALINGI